MSDSRPALYVGRCGDNASTSGDGGTMSCSGLIRLICRCTRLVHAYGPGWPFPSNRSEESIRSLWSQPASAGTCVTYGPCHGHKDDDNLLNVRYSSHLLANKLNMAVAGYGKMRLATSAGDGNLLEQTLYTLWLTVSTIPIPGSAAPCFPVETLPA